MKVAGFLVVFLCLADAALGQGGTVEIDELSAPMSPAFVLLGIEPAAVERPESPKALVVSAASKLTSGEGFPRDYAIQVAPYWLKSHPSLALAKYQNPRLIQSIEQTFAVSIGTAPIAGATEDSEPRGTHLALGFTVRPWNGRPNPGLSAMFEGLDSIADERLDLAKKEEALKEERKRVIAEMTKEDMALENLTKELGELERDAPGRLALQVEASYISQRLSRLESWLYRIESQLDRIPSEIKEVENKATVQALRIQAADAQRVGGFLTISGGRVWNFVGDAAASVEPRRKGLWITPAWRELDDCEDKACEASIDFIGLFRMLKDPDTDAIVDGGFRILFRPNKDFHISIESVWRDAPSTVGAALESTENSNRTAGIIEYNVKDDLILFATFGQDFKKATSGRPILALLGLNVGFGRKPVLSVQ